MLSKRISRLEKMAPAPADHGDAVVRGMLNRLATLKWLSGTRDLTPDEQSEYAGLWKTLGGQPC